MNLCLFSWHKIGKDAPRNVHLQCIFIIHIKRVNAIYSYALTLWSMFPSPTAFLILKWWLRDSQNTERKPIYPSAESVHVLLCISHTDIDDCSCAQYLMICQFLHCAMTPFFVLQHNYLIQQFFLLISVAAWLKLYEPEVVVFGWHGHNFANFWHILFDVLSQCHAPRCDVRVLVWNVFFSTNEPLLDRCGISVLFVQMPLKYCNGAPLFSFA